MSAAASARRRAMISRESVARRASRSASAAREGGRLQSLASSAFTSEVLPAPEGAAMTNSLPGFRGREATLHRAEGPRSWCGNIALLPEHRDELAQRLSAVAHGVLLHRVELGGRAGAPLGNEHRVVAEAAEAAW